MADKRKLQGEIDRCLKKVEEGVEAFEEIWKKMDATNNTNQKEKFEADLKKEIKKLQRLRDQIKAWAVCPDIKDKQILNDNRKLIESRMERFKVIEREAKIKAYSKEGLGASGKVDPKEKEKEEITAWISQSIDQLNVQIDKFESEVEALTSRKKKLDRDEQDRVETYRMWITRHRFHINKLEAVLRMVDNSAVQFDEIRKIQEGVNYYIESNQDAEFIEDELLYDELDLEDAGVSVRTDIIASSPSESSDIDVLIGGGAGVSSSVPTADVRSPSTSSAPSSHTKHKGDEDGKQRRQKQLSADDMLAPSSNAKTNLSVKIANSSSGSGGSKVSQTPTKTTPSTSTAPSTPVDMPTGRSLASAPSLGYAQVAGSHHGQPTSKSAAQPSTTQSSVNSVKVTLSSGSNGLVTLSSTTVPTLSQLSTLPSTAMTTTSASAQTPTLLNSSTELSSTAITTASSTSLSSFTTSNIPAVSSDALVMQGLVTTTVTSQVQLPSVVGSFKLAQNQGLFTEQTTKQQSQQQSLLQTTSQLDNDTKRVMFPAQITNGPQSDTTSSLLSSLVPPSTLDVSEPLLLMDGSNSAATYQQQKNDALSIDMSNSLLLQSFMRPMPPPGTNADQSVPGSLVPSSAVSSMPPTTTIRLNPLYGVAPLGPQPFTKEHSYRLNMLDAAYRHLPHPSDSQRSRTYFPSNPCPTPPYYPLTTPSTLNSPDFFSKMDTSSLFFIFYYMEGTKAQFLAAKALKQKSWRFHTKYMMWFQRHEEPKTITEEYEQGTYIYFDYEKWSQRKKEEFKFEYRFLEDHDLS